MPFRPAVLIADACILHAERYPVVMGVNVTIRDLPEDIHRVLRERAAASGQSMQEYLVGRLRDMTARPTMEEWVADVEANRHGGRIGLDEAAQLIRTERDLR
jgi:plasmid stability protein